MANLNDITEQVRREITKQPGLTMTTCSYEGPAVTLESMAEEAKVGFAPPTGLPSPVTGDATTASAHYTRLPGNRGRLDVTVAVRESTETWDLDWMEIQKPIKSWNFSVIGNKGLVHISQWESIKESHAAEYEKYQYIPKDASSAVALAGDELKLAQMIAEGIDHYNVYTPVLIRKSHPIHATAEKDVGTVCTPTAGSNCPDTTLPDSAATLAKQWLKVADTQQGNTDGTVTRVERWIGADAWNENLYGNGSSAK